MVRRRLLELTVSAPFTLCILDVGGRKSHYTVGIPAAITVTDLPRCSTVQEQLHLGITPQITQQLLSRRTNIKAVLLDDMTKSSLPDARFDIVVAVEVLEHVAEDELFVSQVRRVLKPGGTFLMTTPNGDSVKNTNPDHKRHYRRVELDCLLRRHFNEVDVRYAVLGNRFYSAGLKSWSVRHPVQTMLSMFGNFVCSVQSSRKTMRDQALGTQHLCATAVKAS
jgi:SAM-dependent methyltransferase